MKYFLGRVSSKEQNLARQLKVAREKFDIPDENVYCDKITGSSFDRPQYNALKAIVQEGDEVIVKEFDRFGRNKDEMKRELEWFKQKGVIVRILDIPTTLIDFKDQTWVLEMVNNILIEVLGAVAEQERKKLEEQREKLLRKAREDARRIASKYAATVIRNFQKTRNLWEKYNVVEGNINVSNEYEMPTMVGWTAGTFVFATDYLDRTAR